MATGTLAGACSFAATELPLQRFDEFPARGELSLEPGDLAEHLQGVEVVISRHRGLAVVGKPRRRKASASHAGHVAEAPGPYGSLASQDSAAEREAALALFPAASQLSAMEREAVSWGLFGSRP